MELEDSIGIRSATDKDQTIKVSQVIHGGNEIHTAWGHETSNACIQSLLYNHEALALALPEKVVGTEERSGLDEHNWVSSSLSGVW